MLSNVAANSTDLSAPLSPVRFGVALKRAQHLLALKIDEALQPKGLNIGLWAVLREAAQLPGASASELARASSRTPQTVGELLQRLQARGLIERSTGRGRIVENHLTDLGRETLRWATQSVETIIAAALAEFSDEDSATLERLINDLAAALAQPRPAR